MAKLISKTYGEALLELAQEEQKIDAIAEEVSALGGILKNNPELSSLMNHPKITKEEKIQVIENILKGRVSEELLGFLVLIISKDRYSEIDSILEYFIQEVKNLKGIGVAYVTTPQSLSESQKSAVKEKLLETAGYKEMEIHYSEDAALIGGMIIRIGDRIVDSSIRTKLDKLSKQLLSLQLS